jgi:F-type H+-transporting ATPase subunit epsilon
MAEHKLATSLLLEVVTPEGLLFRDHVDEVTAPGELGYFGVLPGHTPFLSTLGLGEITYRQGTTKRVLTCYWGFAEVLPDRVNILADLGERAEDIDLGQAEAERDRLAAQLKEIKGEAGYDDAHKDYMRAVTRLSAARRQR